MTEEEVQELAREALRVDVPQWNATGYRVASTEHIDEARLVETGGAVRTPFWIVRFAPPDVPDSDVDPDDLVTVLVFQDGTYRVVWQR